MKYHFCTEDEYNTSKWTGGLTKELSIYPQNSKYLDRNFVWRISSATVDVEESDFSKLPDYDRVLMVLEGEVVLSYEGQRVSRLRELEQDRFDGGWKTKSFGKITDFNLMVRKGNEGYVDLIYPQQTSCRYTSTQETEKPFKTHALYCKAGYGVVTFGDKAQMIKQGELLVLEYEGKETPDYSIMGEGVLIRSRIFFDDMSDELGAEIIPEEKATFKDFRTCIYLANVQFRGAQYIVPSLKKTWFDEALSDAISKVEKIYLTYIVFLVGIIGISLGIMKFGLSTETGFIMMFVWMLLDCLLVSPLLYFAVVPKPVHKHIKRIDNLTPYEQRVRAEQMGRNEHLDKLVKKYKNSGRNLGN